VKIFYKKEVLLLGVLFVLGCGFLHKANLFYKKYIYPVAKVDLKFYQNLEPCEQKFIDTIYEIDSKLTLLLPNFLGRERFPSDSWSSFLLSHNNWVSGITVLSKQGEVVYQYPQQLGLKKINWRDWSKSLKSVDPFDCVVLRHSLGPEVVLDKVIYSKDDEPLLLVVHFDLRTFLAINSNSELKKGLVVYLVGKKEEMRIWPNDLNRAIKLNVTWNNLLKNRTYGKLKVMTQSWVWMARKLGRKWLIYAYHCRR